MKKVSWQCILSSVIGVALLTATGFVGTHTWRFIQAASNATGVVTREREGCAHVDVSFQAASGETVEYPQNGEICLHPGQHVKVLYDPSMPSVTATVDSMGALWFPAAIMGVAGLFF